ncbi:MAG: zinc-binding dehydrogenase, partial [Rhodospirillaceae bacterium]|nr:zinc-binding dehydrogenase [Rhodospirillaceae bacterium]
RVIAIDRVADKLTLAKTFGATDVINAAEGDAVEQVMEMTGGGVHYAFEAIGLKRTAEQAFEMLRPGGTATLIGMIPYGEKIELHGGDFLMEKKVIGCSMGSNRFRVDMPRYVDFYLAGKLKLDDLLSSHIKLEDVNEALQALKTGAVARNVIMFDS